MDDKTLKIHIVTDADTSGFKSTSAAATGLTKEVDETASSHKDLTKATLETTDAARQGTEKFSESRREIREVGNEIGRVAGVSRLGGLALGGVSAAAFALGAALEFLKGTWDSVKSTIQGPIEIGIPDDAPAHISAAAEAWKAYAAARAAVIASSQSLEAGASAEEKRLANELKLIKEVLAAQKEKALADLELKRSGMSADAYAATKANINNIFGEAETGADHNARQQAIDNKIAEAGNLEIEAQNKTNAALLIKASPKKVSEANQKALDDNAASAQAAIKDIKERIALIDHVQAIRNGTADVDGIGGVFNQLADAATLYKRYGTASPSDARALETVRLGQAQNSIDLAQSYREREAAAQEERSRLMSEAGKASGRAAGLYQEAGTDRAADSDQTRADAYGSNLREDSAAKITGASSQTAAAVNKALEATVGGFQSIHNIAQTHESNISALTRRLIELERQMGQGHYNGH